MAQSFLALTLLAMLGPPQLDAHPVPRRSHDRTVTVRLTPSAAIVDYVLEVDEWTVVYADLPAVNDQVDLGKLSKPAEFRDAFTRAYAPILAKNLTLRLDGKEIEMRCTRQVHSVADHLRCEFRFEAPWQPLPGEKHTVSLHEGNYELESGMVRLALLSHPDLPIDKKVEPDEALKSRPESELRPGDDEKLRHVWATFEVEGPLRRATTDSGERSRVKPAPAKQLQAGSAKGTSR